MSKQIGAAGCASLALALWACANGEEDAQLEVCESHIKSDLRSPSTYRRVSVSNRDGPPMSLAAFKRETGILAPRSEVDRERERLNDMQAQGRQLSLRLMIVEYDSENAYGTPIRGAAECAFRLLDGQPETPATIRSNGGASSTRRADDLLAQLEGRRRGPRPRYDCCL